MTAVEWLYNELTKVWYDVNSSKELLEQAKEMEKQQIIEAFDEGKSDGYKTAREWDEMVIFSNSEQYYQQTYKEDKQ